MAGSTFDFQNAKVVSRDPLSELGESVQDEGEFDTKKRLASEAATARHAMLWDLFRIELGRQEANRAEMEADAAFYDHDQWTTEERQVLAERGQAAITYNTIAPTVNWILGTERRTRTDFKIMPRTADDVGSAEAKTSVLKYLTDINKVGQHRSQAFKDSVVVGVGWLEDGAQDSDPGDEVIYSRTESWRAMLWDSASREPDLRDCRYMFRQKWVDIDLALSVFPDCDPRILSVENTPNSMYVYSMDADNAMADPHYEDRMPWFTQGGIRKRIRLIEVWYRMPTQVVVFSGGPMDREEFDPSDPTHAHIVATGLCSIAPRSRMKMRVAIMTIGGLVYDGQSPYAHNTFPFTPIWAYRKDADGLPYGMVRGLRGVQEGVNKIQSKIMAILSNRVTIVDEGAVEDTEALREEVSRPDAFIVKAAGLNIALDAGRDLSQAYSDLLHRNMLFIQNASGVTDEQLGRKSNATSGVAITARQEQGGTTNALLFDNLWAAVQRQGEKQLSLVEQYFTDAKVIRITSQSGAQAFTTVNDGLPENSIQRATADFLVEKTDFRASVREAQADRLMSLMEKVSPFYPTFAVAALDKIIDLMDLPNGDEIIQRLHMAMGQQAADVQEGGASPIAQPVGGAMAQQPPG